MGKKKKEMPLTDEARRLLQKHKDMVDQIELLKREMGTITYQLLEMVGHNPDKYNGKSFEKLKAKIDKRGIKIPRIKGRVTEKTLINLLLADDENKAFNVIDSWGQQMFPTIVAAPAGEDEEQDEDQEYYHPRRY